jgi:hypothetical protein
MHLSNFSLITDASAHGWLIALNAYGVEWDLHNYADFDGFDYSTTKTSLPTLTLNWHIAERVIEWRNVLGVPNAQGIPIYPSNRFCIFFSDVDYLEVAPRDSEMPDDEDKTISSVSCIESSEASTDYIESGAISCYQPDKETFSYHLVFRFRGGQFIRVGAKEAEFILTKD